ncbi:MAG TPA: hypothetical protein ENG87_05570 [Candidatus Pacearchaeota archaeon]|nr:hypothetical protein BMS3Abin17_00872 [archaeon BMS3Abin17]HDK42826.1 hypothetical protein [Candidatus Pacearchaeota archaeon]HDZ61355.1 hypothetical protein [Candidatus Pacearchaeota archaeon]
MLRYFKNFKKYAFRLELLQEYKVDGEKKDFEDFLKTGKIKKEYNDEEYLIIKNAKDRNASMSRVHVFELPLTDYLKFEFKMYKFNELAGEKIFLLDKLDFEKINSNINFDFWLFDDKIVLKMNYDKEGRFLGFEEIRTDLRKFIELKDKLLSISKALKSIS